MGMFSWECEVCKKSLQSVIATDDIDRIVSVAITNTEEVVQGEYDGYGRIDGVDVCDSQPTCYHQKCWDAAGQPEFYLGPSAVADDQGFRDLDAEGWSET